MSSTSFSAEQGPPKRSATEILASRYRHLFVLPSTRVLLFYSAVASLALTISAAGQNSIFSFLPTIMIFVLSALAVSSALYLTDKKTIATFRRTSAVLLAGEITWLICIASGLVYSSLTGSPSSLNNAILFGAFACAGLESLVVGGAFTDRGSLALGLAVIHPLSTFVIISPSQVLGRFDPFAFTFGVLAFAVVAAFTFLLKRKKTTRGHSALGLFHAFIKTWTNDEASELEAVISDHSEDAKVTTKVLRFRTSAGDVFIVLPSVHPGPFHPVGSYDLPGVLTQAFKDLGPVMTLHRPGGHERNLATREATTQYARQTSDFARSISTSPNITLKGPIHANIGKAKVNSTAFSGDLILTVSFAPLGSDDLSAGVEEELAGPAAAEGFQLTVVDAHNSIDGEQEQLETTEPGWGVLFGQMRSAKGTPFKVGYSHSSELGFAPLGDLTENGVALFMVESNQRKSVLVLADANNAVPKVRAEVSRALESSGYDFVEFCTSDTHNLAARGLTVARGYKALGEETPVESVAKLVADLAKLAETRLAPSGYGSGELTTTAKIFGAKALEEFAGIMQSSSALGRAYLKFAVASVAVLLALSILL